MAKVVLRSGGGTEIEEKREREGEEGERKRIVDKIYLPPRKEREKRER